MPPTRVDIEKNWLIVDNWKSAQHSSTFTTVSSSSYFTFRSSVFSFFFRVNIKFLHASPKQTVIEHEWMFTCINQAISLKIRAKGTKKMAIKEYLESGWIFQKKTAFMFSTSAFICLKDVANIITSFCISLGK